jgi:ribonuclease HII
MKYPDFTYESCLVSQDFSFIAGIDEVGRGCWAGPVVAAAVIIPTAVIGSPNDKLWLKIRDSKTLSKKQRATLDVFIKKHTIWAMGECSNQEIDSIGIAKATQLAMKRAVEDLTQQPDYLLLDGREKVALPIKQEAIIDGDALCLSIAAASIIAKEYRDALMQKYDEQYPGYGFGSHVGYGTKQHSDALQTLGKSPVHRLSYKPLQKYC